MSDFRTGRMLICVQFNGAPASETLQLLKASGFAALAGDPMGSILRKYHYLYGWIDARNLGALARLDQVNHVAPAGDAFSAMDLHRFSD
jgi:hypothetical protein